MSPRLRPVAQQLNSVAGRYQPRPGRGPLPLRVDAPRWPVMPALADAPVSPPLRPASADRDNRRASLEAILFLAREPLSTRKLSQYANLADATEARTLIRQLNERYDASGRSFRVEEIAGGYQLRTRPKFAAWLRRLEQIPKETRLSAPALETLAVIAYRQPAARAEIEAVRGVNCGEVLRQLMDRGLVKIAGRGDELGRPYLYATTSWFLQLFGLRSLDDLPRADELKRDGAKPDGATKRSSGPPPNPSTNALDETIGPERSEEESHVTATISPDLTPAELKKLRRKDLSALASSARDDAEEEFEKEEVDDEEEDWDDGDDDEEDFEDDDFDDEEEEDEEEEDEDEEDAEEEEGFEEETWEEVEDDDEEEEWEEEDDDDDDDWDDDDDEEEEEEEEDWE